MLPMARRRRAGTQLGNRKLASMASLGNDPCPPNPVETPRSVHQPRRAYAGLLCSHYPEEFSHVEDFVIAYDENSSDCMKSSGSVESTVAGVVHELGEAVPTRSSR